jgi:hypothetical protein
MPIYSTVCLSCDQTSLISRITCCIIIFIILVGKARIDGPPESRTLVSEPS